MSVGRMRKPTGSKPAGMGKASSRHYNENLLIPGSIITLYASLWWFSQVRINSPPPVQPASSPLGVFSEERAMRHVRVLADDNPERHIGTLGAQRVADYIEGYGMQLVKAAASRNDITVEVFKESTSGAFECEFSFAQFTSAYFNALNVVYRITPRDAPPGAKAVLLNSHFDNSRGSPGASDCASCVGVMMESASVLVHNSSMQLAGPLVFLFNGAEETLFQGAHAFTKSSHVPLSSLGAFINLESTGPGGYETMIQHKGAWTAEAYARAAPYPRGSVWCQDQLDLKVIPGTTDYVIFSRDLPGLDLAFMMDAGAYHTREDKTDRIAPGWVQSMGENALATAAEFARVLADDARGPTPGAATAATDKVVFMDIFGYFMLTLAKHHVEVVRAVPLVMALSLPVLHHMLRGGGGAAKPGALAAQYMRVLRCFGLSLASLLASLLTGGLVMGALRAQLSGRPMVWFGNHLLTCLTYLPASLAAGMSVYMAASPQPELPDFLASYALLSGLVAYGGATIGIGGSILFTFTGVGACLLLLLDPKGSFHSVRTAGLAHAVNIFPLVLSVASSFFGIMHVMEKVTFIGHAPPPFTLWVQDMGIGLILAMPLWFDTALLLPFFVYNTRPYWKVMLAGCIGLSLGTAGWATAYRSPYSEHLPKRVWAQHVTEADGLTGQVLNSSLVFGSWDNVPASVTLPEELRARRTTVPRNGREWLSVPFILDLFMTEVYEAPAPEQPLDMRTVLTLARAPEPAPAESSSTTCSSSSSGSSGDGSGSCHARQQLERLHFTLRMPEDSSMTSLNFKGARVERWSLTEGTPPRTRSKVGWSQPLWLTGAADPRVFDFWVDVARTPGSAESPRLVVEVSVSEDHAEDGQLEAVLARMPAWVSLVSFATTQAVLKF